MKAWQKFRERTDKAVVISKKYAWRVLFVATLVLGGFLIGRPAKSIAESNDKIEKLAAEEALYQEKIIQDTVFIDNLNNNDEFLVQFAREKFFMHGKDEQVIIVEELL
jgi:predicted nuclease of restriction endonuclease-like (RecB) superfamily